MASSAKKYKTSFSKEWMKTYTFISQCSPPVPIRKHMFYCNICNLDSSCAAVGSNDIKRHSETPSHKQKSQSIKGMLNIHSLMFAVQRSLHINKSIHTD